MIALAVVVALATVSAASGQPQRSSAQPQWILFTADPTGLGVNQIFRITQTGKDLKQITRGNYSAVAPAFSPNGTLIAFATGSTTSKLSIDTVSVEGRDRRRITGSGFEPTWQPVLIAPV